MEQDYYFPSITEREKLLPFYVATIGKSLNEEKISRRSGIDDFQLLYCVNGEGYVLIKGEEIKITAGMGFFLPPHAVHYYYGAVKPWETKWITFNGSAAEQVLKIEEGTFKIVQWELLNNLFDEMLFLPQDDTWSDNCSVKLYKFLLQFKKCITVDNVYSVYDIRYRLKPVTDYIKQNYSKQNELSFLAGIIGVSPAHLCRLFKAAYHERPFEYINRLRMQKSKELLLAKPQLCISEVGQEVGFNNASYFSMLFKKQEKLKPEQFKKLYLKIEK